MEIIFINSYVIRFRFQVRSSLDSACVQIYCKLATRIINRVLLRWVFFLQNQGSKYSGVVNNKSLWVDFAYIKSLVVILSDS